MRDLVATFWRMAFMDRAYHHRVFQRLASEGMHCGPAPDPSEDWIRAQLEQVVYAMLDSGYPFDEIEFDRFWPIIVREVEPFGIDAEAIRHDVEADTEEMLAQNRRALGMD